MSDPSLIRPLKGFLTLTSASSKESTTSPPPSLKTSGSSNELPVPSFQEHRGSSSSDSSVSSDIGENGFLILTPPVRILENDGLNKIEEEAVE